MCLFSLWTPYIFRCPPWPDEGVRTPGAAWSKRWEAGCSLLEQQVLLTSEPPLWSLLFIKKYLKILIVLMHVRLSVGVWVGESSYLPDLLAWSPSPGSCKGNVTAETPRQSYHFPCLIFKHTCYVPLNRTLVSFYFFCLPLSHSSVWHLDLLGALLALRCHFLMSPVLRAFTLVFLVSMLIPDEPHSVCDDSWVFLGRALIWVHCIPPQFWGELGVSAHRLESGGSMRLSTCQEEWVLLEDQISFQMKRQASQMSTEIHCKAASSFVGGKNASSWLLVSVILSGGVWRLGWEVLS